MAFIFLFGSLELFAMDLLDVLTRTARKDSYTLAITDILTKMTKCTLLQSTTAFTIIAAFLESLFYAYGAPQCVLIANGSQ